MNTSEILSTTTASAVTRAVRKAGFATRLDGKNYDFGTQGRAVVYYWTSGKNTELGQDNLRRFRLTLSQLGYEYKLDGANVLYVLGKRVR